jgi:catalase
LVPGIEPSEDKLLQGRIFSYFDTQRYRMGTNFQQIAINRPRVEVRTNNQDGAFASRGGNGEVNYEPSAQTQAYKDPMVYKASSPTYNQAMTRAAVTKQDHFSQAGEFYRGLSKEEQASLVMNLTGDLKQVKIRQTQAKMVGHFYMADRGLGTQLATALGLSREEVESSMKP